MSVEGRQAIARLQGQDGAGLGMVAADGQPEEAAVGSAVTSAVVMGILLIIVASAITTILYNQLGI